MAERTLYDDGQDGVVVLELLRDNPAEVIPSLRGRAGRRILDYSRRLDRATLSYAAGELLAAQRARYAEICEQPRGRFCFRRACLTVTVTPTFEDDRFFSRLRRITLTCRGSLLAQEEWGETFRKKDGRLCPPLLLRPRPATAAELSDTPDTVTHGCFIRAGALWIARPGGWRRLPYPTEAKATAL